MKNIILNIYVKFIYIIDILISKIITNNNKYGKSAIYDKFDIFAGFYKVDITNIRDLNICCSEIFIFILGLF